MKNKIFTLFVALMALSINALAQQITSMKITINHNGNGAFTQEFPASGMEVVDISDEVSTSIVIVKVEVETSGTVNSVEFAGGMYSTNSATQPEEYRFLPFQKGEGNKWVLEANAELIDKEWLEKPKQKTFEFYVVGNRESTPIYYNNGGEHYKVRFATVEAASGGDWFCKVFKESTASLTLKIDGQSTEYRYSGDGNRDPSQQIGELSTLSLESFWLYLLLNDNVSITADNVSVQMKVYKEGTSGEWNTVQCQGVENLSMTEFDTGIIEHHASCTASQLGINIVGGNAQQTFEANTTYILEVKYQVKLDDKYYFFPSNTDASLYKFSVKESAAIEDLQSTTADNSPIYNLQGQQITPTYPGMTVRHHRISIQK